MKIIIVEDEGVTKAWIKRKIEELGPDYCVEGIFSNGRQALEWLREHETDVIFTDIRMPVMDGLEFLEQIRNLKLQPYKVILSAYDEFHYARRAMKLGAAEFVLKPEITKEGLKQILQDACRYKEQQQPDRHQAAREQSARKEACLLRMTEQEENCTEEEIKRQFLENGIFLNPSSLTLFDIYFERQADRDTVLELLELFLEEKQMEGVCFQYSGQEFGMVCGYQDGETCMGHAREIHDILQIHTGMKVYLGIGLPKRGNHLRELYRQASVAQENRRFFGIAGCRKYDDMRVTSAEDIVELCFGQEVKDILQLLAQEQFDDVKNKIQKLLEVVREADYLHPAYVKAIFNEILTSCLHGFWKYSLNEEEKERIGSIKLLFGRSFSSLYDLEEAMWKSVVYMTELLKQKSGAGRYSAPIQEIVKYVEEHYGERITLEQVAESVFLSKAYISALFKKETGKKFSSFLQEVRLEKSRVLLRDTRLSVQEIAVRIGFFDTAHYSHAFKERYGISPLEYRKSEKITKN